MVELVFPRLSPYLWLVVMTLFCKELDMWNSCRGYENELLVCPALHLMLS